MHEYCYKYPRPALTTDCIIFGFDSKLLKVLLIERGIAPFKGKWALPGGFVQHGESTDAGAKRELQEETGLDDIFMEQLYTFSQPNRDPRGWVVSVAYYALVNLNEQLVAAGDDARNARWFSIDKIPQLAFDHAKILHVALQRLRNKIQYQPVGFELLPKKFTLTQLQTLYEAILNTKLDKRNFRRKILKTKLLIALNEKQKNVAHKPARYYMFDQKKYDELIGKGFDFKI